MALSPSYWAYWAEPQSETVCALHNSLGKGGRDAGTREHRDRDRDSGRATWSTDFDFQGDVFGHLQEENVGLGGRQMSIPFPAPHLSGLQFCHLYTAEENPIPRDSECVLSVLGSLLLLGLPLLDFLLSFCSSN